MQNKSFQKGMTLIEILIVVVIVAILAAIAVPSYRDQVIRSKRAVGTAELLEVLSLQEQYFLNNKQYATTLVNLGYATNPYYIGDEGEQTTAGAAIYQIRLDDSPAPTTTSFILEAIPQNGQAADTDCGTLTLTHLGARGAGGSVTKCW